MQAFLCPLQVAKKEVSPLVISLPRFHSLHSLPLLASLSHLARAMRCEDELSQLSNGFVVAAVECTYTLDHERIPKGSISPSLTHVDGFVPSFEAIF